MAKPPASGPDQLLAVEGARPGAGPDVIRRALTAVTAGGQTRPEDVPTDRAA